MKSKSRTSHARQPAITSLVESELDPPVPPHLTLAQEMNPMPDLNLRARFPGASDTYIGFAQKFFRDHQIGTFTELHFWELIDEARSVVSNRNSENENERLHRQALTTAILGLDNGQLYDAAGIYWRRYVELYDRKVWSAVCIVWGGCSDDSFMDFCEWVLSQGESAFRTMKDDPDSLPELMIRAGTDCPFFEGGICGPIWHVFEDRTGGYELPLLDQGFPELTGEWIEEVDASRLLPKCFAHRNAT